MYLYQAIEKVIRNGGNKPMAIEDIAEAINEQGLYVKKDGSTVSAWNVGARVVSDISKSSIPMFDVLVRMRD
ncbi:MAG: hypothetical protein ACTSV7_14385 [Candidatus Baldrarchaeia archaeon]